MEIIKIVIKKIFILFILGFHSTGLCQSSERSIYLDNIQKRIDDLNLKISLLKSDSQKLPNNSAQNNHLLYTETETINVSPIDAKSPVANYNNELDPLKFRDSKNNQVIDSLNQSQFVSEKESIQLNKNNTNSSNGLDDVQLSNTNQMLTSEYKSENRNEKTQIIENKTEQNQSYPNDTTHKPNESKNFFELNNLSNLNSLSFYMGVTMPNKSVFRRYGIQFEEGEQYSVEYHRKFGYFFIGSTIAAKIYDNKKITGIKVDDTIKGNTSDYIHLIDTGQIRATGENKLYALTINAGWQPKLTNRIFLRNKFAVGLAHSNKELKIEDSVLTQSDTVFYYSLLFGLGIQWSNNINSLFYYQFDGQSETARFDDQTFHEIGLSLGVNY
jgi:hypothetical protein